MDVCVWDISRVMQYTQTGFRFVLALCDSCHLQEIQYGALSKSRRTSMMCRAETCSYIGALMATTRCVMCNRSKLALKWLEMASCFSPFCCYWCHEMGVKITRHWTRWIQAQLGAVAFHRPFITYQQIFFFAAFNLQDVTEERIQGVACGLDKIIWHHKMWLIWETVSQKASDGTYSFISH